MRTPKALRFAWLIVLLMVSVMTTTQLEAQTKIKWHATPSLPLLGSGHLVFVDSLVGYYIGQDTGFVTMDGAQSWTQMTFSADARPNPSFIYAPSPSTVILYQNGVDSDVVPFPGIIKTTNYGKTWVRVADETARQPQHVQAFTMWNANDGFRIWLDDGSQKDSCKVTHNGGITWTEKRGDATLEKYISKFTASSGKLSIKSAWSDSLNGAISVSLNSASSASTAYPVLITSDGGRTWTETYPQFAGNATVPHTFVYTYPGSKTLWVLPSALTKIEYFLYYSTNFGSSWTNTTPLKRNELGAFTKAGILELSPVSPSTTWAVLASDTEHPDLTKFIARHDINTGWVRDTAFNYGGGQFGYSFNSTEIQFADPNHGWAWATASAFVDDGAGGKKQVYLDSLFLFRYGTAGAGVDDGPTTATLTLRAVPNPASSTIRFKGFSSQELVKEVSVVNSLGNRYSPSVSYISGECELDVRNLTSGSYVVSITTSRGTHNVPVMVVH